MKRRFTILTAALALLVSLAIPMGVWGQTTHTIGWGTASGDAGTYTNFTATSGSVANILSFSTAKNSANNAPAYNASNKELRLYNASNGDGCSITITPSSGLTITQIVITATSGYTSDIKYSVNGGTATAATWSNNTCTISGIEASTSLMVQNVKTSTQQLRIKTIAVMYAVDGPVTYTVTYDCNGGTNGCPEDLTGLSPNTSITLANAPTKEHFIFEGWSDGTNTYDAGDSYTVNSHVTFTAQWESDGTVGEGSICFSSQSSCTAINGQSVTGEDNLGNTWTITTAGTSSFTANSGYYQVGSGNSPASSITFTTTLDEEVNVTDFSAMFGGFSATRASVVLKVDDTQVGSGTLNGAADVTVSSSSAQIGTTLTVIVTPTAGGVKCYNISYAYETIDNPAVATTTTINVPQDFNTDIYQGTAAGTLTATVSAEGTPISGATVTWSSSNTGVATIDNNGAVTLVAVGTTTITANYAGVEDQYRPSTGTYELTVTDSNAPGTENNPYTVAQAIYAIDNDGNVTGVYATGIVSNIDYYSENNHYITYYISADGSTTGDQLEAFHGKGINGADFSSIDDIQVGDVVVIYGNLTKYNSTYEFAADNELVSLVRPTNPIIIANDINLTYDATSGSIAYSISNPTSATLTASSDADWISNIVVGSESVTFTTTANEGDEDRSATITLSYTGADDKVITVTQAHYVPDYATLPFAFNNGKNAIEETNGLTQSGLGSDYSDENTKLKFDSTDDYVILKINERPGTLTFNIKGNSFSGGTFKVQTSADGVSYSDLETYDTFGSNETYEEEFDNLNENVRYIKWIYTQKVSGNVGLGNINLAKYVAPQEYTLEVTNISNAEIIVFDATNPDDTQWEYLFEGIDEVQVPEGTRIALSVSAVEGYVLETLVVNNVDHVADIEGGAYIFTMPANNVTISATAVEYVAPTGYAYVLYTGELVEGDYLIVYDGGAMNTTVTSDRLQYEDVTVNNDVITTDNAAIVWHIAPSGQYWTIYNADAEAYAASTGAKNKAQMLADGTDDKALWTVSVSGTETYEFVNKKNAANNVNANLRKNGEYGFACYATSTGGALSLYKKVALTIKGYGEVTNRGGYYLIASPLGTINPENVPGMLSDSYDLYRFDQVGDAQGNEWINYKGDATNPGMGNFDLEIGKGYLYAHSSDITLNFTGMPIEGTTYEVTLTKNESARFKGWNLVGNPFAKTAYIDNTHNAYYTMDAAGALFVPVTGNSVDPMEGIFVVAKSDEEIITFSTTNPNEVKCSTLALNLSQRQSLLDRAIVRFDEGSQLPKLQFNRNSSKVCIPMDDEDYAVVRAEEMGEMPVNFKAESNGTYSLNFGMDNVEFAYLHLIDNLTGNEVDLLQTPSYSFEAKTTDYENRFKLVFATGDNSNEDNFAYFSNGSFVINNEGNATLQVIDITGRIVKSESVNGCANVNVNGAAGVYMLRLVNGDNVKVQKVVVK